MDDTSNPYSALTSYEIAVSYSVIEAIAQEALQTNYDTSAHYELFVSSRLDEFETEYTIGTGGMTIWYGTIWRLFP